MATKSPDVEDRHGTPLSFGQERLWLSHLLAPRSPVYNIPVVMHLRGALDVEALERSLAAFVERHDALRVRIDVADGHARQRVADEGPARLLVTDLTSEGRAPAWERAMELLSTEASRPFDLRRGPLYRASLVLLEPTESVFAFVVHHIAFDGWSREILLRELASLYRRFAEGGGLALPEPPVSYAEFAEWQREAMHSSVANEGLAFWRQLLAGDPQRLELPTDRPRPRNRSYSGHNRVVQATAHVLAGLKELARSESSSLYVTLIAAYMALLHRYTGQDDVVIGTAVAGRTRPIDHDTVGFFVNTLPVRGQLTADPTFQELVRRLHPVVMGELDHQDIPLEKLTQELGLSHEAGETPLFQVLFNLEPLDAGDVTMPGLEVAWLDVFTDTAKFDLTLTARESAEGLWLRWEYSSEIFDGDTIERMAAHFGRLISHVAAHPETRLSDLPLLTDAERRLMLVDWNDTRRDYPREKCVHELFEEQVQLAGDRVALVAGDVEVTYAELNERANQLAHRLQKEGVNREVPVGLCLDRSVDMIIGMLGILKAGGAYVPLDPDYPSERLHLLVEDSGLTVIVTDAHAAPRFPRDGRTMVDLHKEAERIAQEPTANLPLQGRSDDLVYIMYTSGSTGKPKGVCVVHRGVTRLVKGTDYANFGPEEIFLLLSTFSFDISTFEIWGCLLNGGRLVIGPPHLSSYKELGHIIRETRVSTLWLTSGLFHNVVDADLEMLAGPRQLLVGGDVVSTDHAVRFKARFPDCRLINGYGPTENTSFTTTYEISGAETGPLPIGRPIANTTTYILDSHLRPVPVGVLGELWTGGDGLARGYLNDPELTAARFVTSTSLGLEDPVIYRTGDLARYRPDGVILFEGRQDHQVKVNGFRVEIEEVETLLLGHPDLAQVSVNPHRSSSGETQLVAHCVPRAGSDVTVASLRAFLQDRAPGYMVPASFVMMDELPLTHAGKVDRRALPEPRPGDVAKPEQRFEARDALETTILSIWQGLFGVDTIGVQDNFFDLGGHSLLAFRFFARLEQETGILLPLGTMFEAPTIERLARVVRKERQQARKSRIVPIKPDGTRRPIFFIHGIGGNVLRYGELARHLDADQPAFGIDAIGLDGEQRPLTRIEDMARRNIEEIKAIQPDGPYVLAGGSFAGMVAFEMARQLANQGESVSLLALFDTFLVGPSVGTRLRSHARNLATAPPQQKLEYLRERVAGRRKWAKRRHWQRMIDQGRQVSEPASTPADEVLESNHLAVRRYVDNAIAEHPYPGRAILFVAGDRGKAQPPPVDAWDRFVSGELEKIVVPGDHGSILEEPNVRFLAQLLEERLQRPADDSTE